ncbi:hypothetical protein FRACYDRAFT_234435 [Fragilariopsis cylindrus CCMP1102]|uniref:RING-type domain-containing protein n=1 Tax=Fragilariopsis cylindrus CCMP1102 TaxID=635003 RepID=A0A1E7FSI9_9STRA|nr:hypothetical protein FRACYDRAFT_234435 [Fragilariopsis cylindrus CCMP1102]|eukprot:OEU20803.1 hypothetical protein FRACYDRAFT_234435 [Fragilariopsis cylindrus CCMP1102]
MTSCPICLEDIFQPPPATDGIGNANNNNHNIGATVPCGHLYHYGCFDAWRASSHGRAIKCPTCNIKTTDFTRLFLDITSINGLVCQMANSGEDDISLSSIEDDDDDGDENDESGSTAEVEVEIVESNVQEEEEGNTATSTSSTEASTTLAAAEVVVGAEEVVDLTHHDCDGDGDGVPHVELQRLTRIAKKFKRQFLQKNLQYKEQYNEKRKLSDRVRQVDEELLEMQSGMEEIERNQSMTILHLKESRLSLQRTLTEREILTSKYSMMEKLKSKLDSQLKKCHTHYEKELEKARTSSMSEVIIVHRHLKLVKVGSGQYSSFASRMLTASAKKSSQNAFVKEMLSSSRDGKNKTSESKKRSSSSSSSTSLSLSQNKRMKSSNDARRFFQPKPS